MTQISKSEQYLPFIWEASGVEREPAFFAGSTVFEG